MFVLMVYGMLTFKTGLMLLLFLGFLFAFIGPGYAFLYVLRTYLEKYPVGNPAKPTFEHPEIFAEDAKKLYALDTLEISEEEARLALEELYKEGLLRKSGMKNIYQKRQRKNWKKQKSMLERVNEWIYTGCSIWPRKS